MSIVHGCQCWVTSYILCIHVPKLHEPDVYIEVCIHSRVLVHCSGRSLFESAQWLMNPAMDRFVSTRTTTYLVARENQRISNHNVFTASSSKHNDLSNVVGGQWLAVST